jgi:V8-like Glu-specific endopeptidase
MYFPNQDEYPNNCTVYIQVAWDDGTFTRGSGAMVGRNDVLTASHVVYSPGKTAVDIDVFPAYDGAEGPWGSFTDGTWQTNYYEVGNADKTISKSDSAWDLAVIGLSDAMGDRTGWYGMRSHQDDGTYELLGYPGDQGTKLTGDSGYVNYEDGVYDISNVYHSFGSSGGPILNEANEVCGVVSSTSYGARIDDEWDNLIQWMSANDSLLA